MNQSVPAPENKFRIRGIKGLYWRLADYLDVARILPQAGFNFMMLCYTMAPESSIRWRAPYTPAAHQVLRRIADFCAQHGIELCLAINPVVANQTMDPASSGMPFHPSIRTSSWFQDFFRDFWYTDDRFGSEAERIPDDELVSAPFSFSSEQDFDLIISKLKAVWRSGVTSFALCMDDLDPTLSMADQAVFGSSAEAQISLLVRLRVALHSLDPAIKLYFCPTHYCTRWAEVNADYTAHMAEQCPKDVTWFWTGPEIISATLNSDDAAHFKQLSSRQPVLWMNYPCNDFLKRKLQLAPFKKPEGMLWEHLAGMMINPMVQPQVSKLQILAMSHYLNNPTSYDPEIAQEVAIQELVPPAASDAVQQYFRLYAQEYPNVQEMDRVGVSTDSLRRLKAAAERLEQSVLVIQNTLNNRALYRELGDGLRRLQEYIEVCDIYLSLRNDTLDSQGKRTGERTHRVANKKEVLGREKTEVAADALYMISIIESLS